jgi:hypothetical protein
MTTALANTIIKDGHVGPQIERVTHSGTTLKPGHLVDINSSNAFVPVGTQGADFPTCLLVEDRYQGDGSVGGVDQVYAVGAPAVAEFPPAGALRYVRVPNGTVTALGSKLIYNNAGQLIVTTGSPLKVVAIAEEALTASGEQLILVRIA